MEFSELLNQIIERTGCTAKELSEISGISPASLSRYRSGERMPEYEQMQKLLQGLKTLIKERGVSDIDEEALQATQKELMEQMVKDNTVVDEVPFLSEEEFAKYPMSLSLSDIFYEEELTYTYEEYLQHLDMTKAFAITHANYTVKLEENHAFRNIQIRIHEGKCVIVSKNKAPAIHFVIRHPLMRKAFENFVVPMVEEK